MTEALRIPQSVLDEQFAASNPDQSAWVSANAGSGKTHVLTQRVIRLMLSGNAPDRILCLTFTKAAAANMKNRVFGTLAKWTMLPNNELVEAIEATTGRKPFAKTIHRARQLFAEALDTPGGLKIQTIHAFCESLLHQFPLEANLAGHFEVIQDPTQSALLAEAQSSALGLKSSPVTAQAFTELLSVASDTAIEDALKEIISKRQKFVHWIEKHGDVEGAIAAMASLLDLSPGENEPSIKQSCLEAVDHHITYFESARPAAEQTGKSTDTEFANAISGYINSRDTNDRFEILSKLCLTQKGKLRSERRIATGELKKALPELVNSVHACGSAILEAREHVQKLALVGNSHNMFIVANAVLERYDRMKRARGLVDFDDLVWKCVNLLERPDIRDWIRYRLDQGIDHLLVDEAQDTSPAQWTIIKAVTEDFFVGQGSEKRERTVFVVGDEKQSIYSFQGADPKEFERQREGLRDAVSNIGKQLETARFDLSFRSTKDVLHAVDTVFQNQENALGLTQSGEVPPHDAVRSADPGEVQVWPLFAAPEKPDTEDWLAPIDKIGNDDPAVRLAEHVTRAVKDWVGKILPGTGKPLGYGDVLVLVRNRDRFITALTRKMKEAGVAVAGADRLRLLEHIATEDLLAVGRFALLYDDDLNLAALLKGIFFDVDDADLFRLAHNRGTDSLFAQIVSAADDSEHPGHHTANRILPLLEKIRTKAKTSGIFEFYAWLLGAEAGRRKILARLGTEAEDVLDAYMDEIISFTREGGSGLEAFIAQLRKANPEIKRELELDRDEVRILTVHAAKGLEARVVFLVDSCRAAWISNHRPKILSLTEEDQKEHFIWISAKSEQINATLEATEQLKAAAEGEYRRLLYVGMTRAADRLIVCGYHGKRKPGHPHWHQMVQDALEPSAVPLYDKEGNPFGFRWVSEDQSPKMPDRKPKEKACDGHTHTKPDWLFRAVRPDPPLPRPLTPSGAFALIDEGKDEPRKPPFETEEALEGHAQKTGILLHRLLEVLPDIEPSKRAELARRHIDTHAADLPVWQREHIAGQIDAVMTDSAFAPLFSENSRAEVSVIGSLQSGSGLRLISGQIDRLVVSENRALIVDYKTNRVVPANIESVPDSYITQMALYRHVVRELYPDKAVECAILWTSEPRIVFLPEDRLNAAMRAIIMR